MMLDAHFGSIDTCTLLSPRALSLVFAVFGVCFVWCLLCVVSADWGRTRGHTRSYIYLYKYIYMACMCGHVGVAHYWCSMHLPPCTHCQGVGWQAMHVLLDAQLQAHAKAHCIPIPLSPHLRLASAQQLVRPIRQR